MRLQYSERLKKEMFGDRFMAVVYGLVLIGISIWIYYMIKIVADSCNLGIICK